MTDPEPGDAQLGFFEQLDISPQAEYVEPTSSAFFIDQNSIDHILRLGSNTSGQQYSSSSRTVSATRTYPNLSAADVSLIPKTITDSGRTLTLADVQWQNAATTQQDGYDMALRYTANATYTGTATSQYATGYVVTASYHGAVTRVNCDVITYTAIFSSTDPAPTLPAEEDATLTDTPTQAEPQPDAEAAQESTEEGFSFPWALLLLPVALAGLGAAGYFGYKQYRHYINKKRGYE